MNARVSAIDRLRSLPALFRGSDLTVRFQWSSKTTSQYVYLWRQRGLVQPLGGHSDVFANLLVAPQPDWDRAVRMAMPSSLLVGIEVLRRAGWTTQIPQRPDIVVQAGQRTYQVEPFRVSTRPAAWFNRMRHGIDCTTALPALRPAWALADMLVNEGWGACGLWPDDVDFDQDDDDLQSALEASRMTPTPPVPEAKSERP